MVETLDFKYRQLKSQFSKKLCKDTNQKLTSEVQQKFTSKIQVHIPGPELA